MLVNIITLAFVLILLFIIVILYKELSACKQSSQDDKIKIATLETKLSSISQNEQYLSDKFKSLAGEILKENTTTLKNQNKESLEMVLNPVQFQLNEFRKKVDEVYNKDLHDRNELKIELRILKNLNEKISQDAINLTKALKGESKTQGIWGEMILEKVLEGSGLRKDIEYVREKNLQNEDGKNFRPDVIVNLPQDKQVIIDAKTSLVAYEQYVSSDDEQKEIFLKNHIKSIKNHIDELSNKNYEKLQGVNSLDFIFMFVPIESALMLAMQEEKELFDKAFKKKIVLVSPTTLLVALKSIENNWRYEKQAQNITEVVRLSEKLYKKVVMFVDDFDKVGKSLNSAVKSYDEAYKKLSTGRDNIVRQLEVFREKSNIQPTKTLNKDLLEKNL